MSRIAMIQESDQSSLESVAIRSTDSSAEASRKIRQMLGLLEQECQQRGFDLVDVMHQRQRNTWEGKLLARDSLEYLAKR